MVIPSRSTLFALLLSLLCAWLSVPPALAHPPFDPYDDTRFAPITRFGPTIGIEVVAETELDANGNPIPGTELTSPLKAVAAPGLRNHLFVVDQVGKLWVVNLNTGAKTVYLDVSADAIDPSRRRIVTLGVCGRDTFDERGLLGVAFHPKFQHNGLFYTFTSERRDTGTPTIDTPGTTPTNADHHNVIIEWRANNPGSPTAPGITTPPRELMRVAWPQFNHDGGDLAFGPDGMLYISFGDGGGADDADGQPFILAPPHRAFPPFEPCGSQSEPIFGHQDDGNAQKLNTPLGKILRIDVNRPFSQGKQYRVPGSNPFVGKSGAVPEIWALGFRNPYRFSFDAKSGDLYVGDVGQNDVEEVDIVKKGENLGWNCKEGTLFFHINGDVPDDGFAARKPVRGFRRGDCTRERFGFIDPIAQHDTHHEGHSVIGGFVYHGREVPELRGKYVYGDFSLLFKFPRGPHDYGRIFAIDAGGERRGLRSISQLLVLPGGAVSLAVLGIGQDAKGEVYVMGNIFGVPFGTSGKVLRLTRAPEADDKDHDHDSQD